MYSNRNEKNDIILRAIKQFVDMLAAVLKKKQAGQVTEARHELEQMYSTFYGIDHKMILALDPQTLKAIVGDLSKIRALVQLLHEHASILHAQSEVELAELLRTKANVLSKY